MASGLAAERCLRLSIVIPCYNEAATVRTTVEHVARVVSDPASLGLRDAEIIVVDDGSTDRSVEVLRGSSARVLQHPVNRGKGAAVKTGFSAATGDVLVVQDADLEYDPSDIPSVVAPIVTGRADVVLGCRLRRETPPGGETWTHRASRAGNRVITSVTNALYRHDAFEYEGGYKAVSRDVVGAISVRSDDFDFDNELVCRALLRGYRVVDVPIRYTPRDYDSGKKIRWWHGLKILRTIVLVRATERRARRQA